MDSVSFIFYLPYWSPALCLTPHLNEGFRGVCLDDGVDGSDPWGLGLGGLEGSGGKGLRKMEENIFWLCDLGPSGQSLLGQRAWRRSGGCCGCRRGGAGQLGDIYNRDTGTDTGMIKHGRWKPTREPKRGVYKLWKFYSKYLCTYKNLSVHDWSVVRTVAIPSKSSTLL